MKVSGETKVGQISKKVQERRLKWCTVWAYDGKREALCGKDSDGKRSTREKEERKA